MMETKQKMAARRKAIEDDLRFNVQELQTVDDIRNFLEKLVNGILGGSVSRDISGQLAMFIPQLVKLAKTGGAGSIRIEATKVAAMMTPEQFKEFMKLPDGAAQKFLSDIEKKRKEEIVDVETVESLAPETLRIPARDIAKLSDKTDIPLTTKQVRNLFGDILGDTANAGFLEESLPVDNVGFGDIFAKDGGGLPADAQPVPHEYGTETEKLAGGLARMWWVCRMCGKKGVKPDQSEPCSMKLEIRDLTTRKDADEKPDNSDDTTDGDDTTGGAAVVCRS